MARSVPLSKQASPLHSFSDEQEEEQENEKDKSSRGKHAGWENRSSEALGPETRGLPLSSAGNWLEVVAEFFRI